MKPSTMIQFFLMILHLTALAFSIPLAAQGFDASRLWLPKSEAKHYKTLLAAAELATADESCSTLLEGTIDLEQSSLERPLFRIQCRGPDGLSFNTMIEGQELQALPSTRPDSAVLDGAPIRSRKIDPVAAKTMQSQRIEMADVPHPAWPACQSALVEQTQKMLALKWLQKWPLQAEPPSAEQGHFTADFDAVDPYRQPLRYRALCTYGPDSAVKVEILRRPR